MIEDLIHYKTDIKVDSGKLLISEPMLRDKCFQKTVIYICHHNATESFGYVLNRKDEYDLSYYIKDLNGIHFPLYIGGPVDLNSLHMIHCVPELIGGHQIDGAIFWNGDLDAAIENIKLGRINEGNCKFFIGYSGWSEGQLDAELDMNSWLVANTTKEFIFQSKETLLWKEAIKRLGKKFNPLLYIPLNPEMN